MLKFEEIATSDIAFIEELIKAKGLET